MSWTRRCAILSISTLALAACSDNYGVPTAPLDDEIVSVLQPASKLSEHIYDWPEHPFSPSNMALWRVFLKAGDSAIDFRLLDPDGAPVQLAELLEEKPVGLFIGSFTCPVYRESLPGINELAAKSFDGTRSFGDVMHFVHVYVVEAHPMVPDPSPHFGGTFEDDYSTLPQPRKYGVRRSHARLLQPMLDEGQILLVDELRAHGADNPVWSTYGSGAASAWIIRRDGSIAAAHEWLELDSFERSIERMMLGG